MYLRTELFNYWYFHDHYFGVIHLVVCLPTEPSPPQHVRTQSVTRSEVTVLWEEPASPEGRIVNYTVTIQLETGEVKEVVPGIQNKQTKVGDRCYSVSVLWNSFIIRYLENSFLVRPEKAACNYGSEGFFFLRVCYSY